MMPTELSVMTLPVEQPENGTKPNCFIPNFYVPFLFRIQIQQE